MNHANGPLDLLTTNSKTIKLWKVCSIKHRRYAKSRKGVVAVPKVSAVEEEIGAKERKQYSNGHDHSITHLSFSRDCMNFLSACDTRICLWDLEVTNTAYNLIDIKPEKAEDLDEVLTSATFSKHDPNQFLVTSSKGSVGLFDLRL